MPAEIPALLLVTPVHFLSVHEAWDRLDGLAGLVVGPAGDHGGPVIEVIDGYDRSHANAQDNSQNLTAAHFALPLLFLGPMPRTVSFAIIHPNRYSVKYGRAWLKTRVFLACIPQPAVLYSS